MTYDQWKTESGYDERDEYDDYDAERECNHQEADVDIVSGEVSCHCGHRWTMTGEEIQREIEYIAAYQEIQERENHREFWRKLTLPIRWPIFRLLERIWPRKSLSVLTDDEIPF